MPALSTQAPLLGVLFLASLAPAQGLPAPDWIPAAGTAMARTWRDFEHESGGGWQVRWNAATGTPRAIFGAGLPLLDWRHNDLDEARRHAWLQLGQRADLLGLHTSEWREVIGARMGRTWTFTFAQWFRGLPVLDGHVDVRIHMRGTLVHLGSTAWPIAADFDIRPGIGEEQAVGAAWLGLGLTPTAVPQPGS
ncbi:MAG: hypothetical protein WAT39_19785, partial [Planctomycetota bacterium]